MQLPVLVGILSTLLAKDGYVTAKELSQKYEMSTRSIYRYVAVLCEGGVPIEAQIGRGGGWRIIDTYKVKATYFTDEEYRRMLLALRSFSLQDDVIKSVTQKMEGLKRVHSNATVLQNNQFVVDSSDISVGNKVNVLSDAISQKLLCTIEYHSKDGVDTVRTVEPYCLIMKDGAWYVYCFCLLRNGFRYFKVGRIVRLDVGEKFVGRDYVVDSSVIQTDVLRDKEMCRVLLSVEPSALSATEEWLGVNAVAKVDDGYVARATLPYDDMLINKIISLGSGVRVETPEKLRLDVVCRCSEICEQNK